jgi:hypothetical protein
MEIIILKMSDIYLQVPAQFKRALIRMAPGLKDKMKQIQKQKLLPITLSSISLMELMKSLLLLPILVELLQLLIGLMEWVTGLSRILLHSIHIIKTMQELVTMNSAL